MGVIVWSIWKFQALLEGFFVFSMYPEHLRKYLAGILGGMLLGVDVLKFTNLTWSRSLISVGLLLIKLSWIPPVIWIGFFASVRDQLILLESNQAQRPKCRQNSGTKQREIQSGAKARMNKKAGQRSGTHWAVLCWESQAILFQITNWVPRCTSCPPKYTFSKQTSGSSPVLFLPQL